MKLKVCGLKDPANIEQVVALGPDYIGFIFYSKSPRYAGALDPAFASGLKGVKKVGVFVNENENEIMRAVERFKLDLVQLHGEEQPDLCGQLAKAVEVIKAVPVDAGFSFDSLKQYEDSCRYFLFDTKSAGFGGSGKMFDHTLLDQYQLATPYFLSGGLSTENIPGLRKGAYSLDVNSRFELAPGIKDIEKLKVLKQQLAS